MLRRRHLHAPIGPEGLRGWLLCFHRAWDEQLNDPALHENALPRVQHRALDVDFAKGDEQRAVQWPVRLKECDQDDRQRGQQPDRTGRAENA
jgi:hypothetical protein